MDIENYEAALEKFHDTLKIYTTPLASWDFYAPTYDALCRSSADLQLLYQLAENNVWSIDNNIFKEKLEIQKNVLLVTDAHLNIVYASQNIWDMNRYYPKEIIGNKPKMFQGEKTCTIALSYISSAVKAKKSFEATVTNYRKDGSTYNCWIKGQPIFNKKGTLVNFVAFEKEVA